MSEILGRGPVMSVGLAIATILTAYGGHRDVKDFIATAIGAACVLPSLFVGLVCGGAKYGNLKATPQFTAKRFYFWA